MEMLFLVGLIAFIWGVLVAAFIQFTKMGRMMTKHLMWFVVATGCGVDFLLLLLLADPQGRIVWNHAIAIFFASSVPVAFRSILELVAYLKSIMEGAKDGEADTASE